VATPARRSARRPRRKFDRPNTRNAFRVDDGEPWAPSATLRATRGRCWRSPAPGCGPRLPGVLQGDPPQGVILEPDGLPVRPWPAPAWGPGSPWRSAVSLPPCTRGGPGPPCGRGGRGIGSRMFAVVMNITWLRSKGPPGSGLRRNNLLRVQDFKQGGRGIARKSIPVCRSRPA